MQISRMLWKLRALSRLWSLNIPLLKFGAAGSNWSFQSKVIAKTKYYFLQKISPYRESKNNYKQKKIARPLLAKTIENKKNENYFNLPYLLNRRSDLILKYQDTFASYGNYLNLTTCKNGLPIKAITCDQLKYWNHGSKSAFLKLIFKIILNNP